MPQPINYLSMVPQVDLGQKLLTGLQAGGDIAGAVQQRRQAEQAKAMQDQYKTDLSNTLNNPTPQAFASLTAKYPQQREAFKQSWDILSEAQKNDEFRVGVQAYNALRNDNVDVAKSLLDERISAMENSNQDARSIQVMRDALDSNPDIVIGQLGLALSSVDSDRWAKMGQEMRAAEIAPVELTQKQAEAKKASVAAQFAESNAVVDLQKKGWEIEKLANDIDISKQNTKIAAMNAALAKEQNELKREELQQKIDAAKLERDTTAREKAAEVESARGNIDNLLNTADRIINTPIGVVESATGPISSRMPTLSQDTADFEALIENLDAQAFLAQVPQMKGLGALSENEGKKLGAALQNFTLRQSAPSLIANVKEAQRLMLKARKSLADKYGVPETIPDTPAASEISTEELNDLIRRYGG